jgi:hypothetical protein
MSAIVEFSTIRVASVVTRDATEFRMAIASQLEVCPSRIAIYDGREKLTAAPLANKVYRGVLSIGEEKLSFDADTRAFHFLRDGELVTSFTEEKEEFADGSGGYYWVETPAFRYNAYAKKFLGAQLLVDFPPVYKGPMTRSRSKMPLGALETILRDLSDIKYAKLRMDNPLPKNVDVVVAEEKLVECDEHDGCTVKLINYKRIGETKRVLYFLRDVLNFK